MDTQARDHLQRCFLLHRRDFGDTSLILEVFSSGHGRLPLVAKGARRPRAGSGALLQPFQPLWLSWSGRGEVRTLTRSEAAGRAFLLSGEALYCGLYLNELLVRLLGRSDPQTELFAFYHSALGDLAGGREAEPVVRRFELQVLRELGYGIALDREGRGDQAVRADGRYRFDPELGLHPVTDANAPAIGGETLLRLAAGELLSSREAREARGLTRALLAPHLGARPLKSRELFQRRKAS